MIKLALYQIMAFCCLLGLSVSSVAQEANPQEAAWDRDIEELWVMDIEQLVMVSVFSRCPEANERDATGFYDYSGEINQECRKKTDLQEGDVER